MNDEDILIFHEEEDEKNLMSKYCNWGCWKELGDDQVIQGPPDTDRYNVPHELKPSLENKYNTFLQCIFEYTEMYQFL